MTQPKSYDVRALALWAPKIAYGMIVGVPRVPFAFPGTVIELRGDSNAAA